MVIFATNMVTRYSRTEFCKVCNIPNNTLTIFAKRGQLSISSARCAKCENKKKPCHNCKALEFIDLDHRSKSGFYINLDFYKKYTQGIAPVKPKKEPKVKEKVKPVPEVSFPVAINDEVEEEERPWDSDGELSELSSDDRLTRAKKFREIVNKETSTRLMELQEAKMRGELMAVSDSKEIISVFAESVKRAYSDSGENVLMLMFEMFSVPDNQRAMMREKLTNSINTAVKNSVHVAQKRIEALIEPIDEQE